MRAVHEDEFFRAVLFEREHILRVTRSAKNFDTVEDAARIFASMAATLGKLPLERLKLLLDVREGPGRNDAAFESMISETRGLFFGRFARRAILLSTMAGVLQSQRLEREAGGQFHVEPFTDEAKALAYLT